MWNGIFKAVKNRNREKIISQPVSCLRFREGKEGSIRLGGQGGAVALSHMKMTFLWSDNKKPDLS